MRKRLGLMIAFAAVLGSTAVVTAADSGVAIPGYGSTPGGHHEWFHGRRGGWGELRKLDLSDAQEASIKKFAEQDFASLHSQAQAVRQQREALEAMTPDVTGYQHAAAQLAQAEASLVSARITQRALFDTQAYALLTPAQKSQLASDKAQHLAHRRFESQNSLAPPAESSVQ